MLNTSVHILSTSALIDLHVLLLQAANGHLSKALVLLLLQLSSQGFHMLFRYGRHTAAGETVEYVPAVSMWWSSSAL